MRRLPRGALRWSLVLASFLAGLALVGAWPQVTGALAFGLALGALAQVFFFLRLDLAERLPPDAGVRALGWGTLVRFAWIVAGFWLLQRVWPAANMIAALAGIFAAWGAFALALARDRGRSA
ncbi:MAG: hypothetical protein IRZ11_05310 [Clostridia bacterium]|nr:hypothetical protein [Clostridia bacterium]